MFRTSYCSYRGSAIDFPRLEAEEPRSTLTVPTFCHWGIYLDKNNAHGVGRVLVFLTSFFVLSGYINCEAVAFLMKTVLPPYMLLEGGTVL